MDCPRFESRFLLLYDNLRYPIVKTSINLNLIKKEELPKLSRHALLSLVEWFKKQKTKYIEIEIKSESFSTCPSAEADGHQKTQINSKGDDQ